MVNLPIRALGDLGVITDVEPHSLPLNAFSFAKNVRFDEGKVSRSPVFRTVKASLGFDPRLAFGVSSSSGFDTVVMVSDAWVIQEYSNGSLTNRSGSISGSTSTVPFTGTSLANVTYLNRSDRVPVFRLNTGTNFADLTNWDANWRASSLRAYGDFLIALNMTEGSTNYPQRVRYSTLALANAVPSTWDATDTTQSAGFNDLVQMKSAIVDGSSLGSSFIIYSSDQVWAMDFVGGAFIFNFRKLFADTGVINQNCIVEAEGKHFVFGTDDIYVHDGNTKQSIVDERVKNFIFNSMQTGVTDRFFAHHNPLLSEIYFCYVSGDPYVSFPNAERCNRAAVYNYKNGSWSFLDLPNISTATIANVNSVSTFASTSISYNLIGGTYYSQEGGYDQHFLMAGKSNSSDGLSSDKLYGLDLSDTGVLTFAADSEALKSPYLERTGIDLDDQGLTLSGYKVISKITPQITTTNTNKNVSFTFGASNLASDNTSYGTAVTFTTNIDSKIDTRVAGRYLSYKMEISDVKDFSFVGFDAELNATGRR